MSKTPSSGAKSPRASKKSRATFASTPIGLRELLDASPDAIFCVGAGGEWNWLSPAIEPIAGVKASDLIGASCADLVSARERFRFLRDFARIRKHGATEQPEERTLTLTRKDETECRVAFRVRYIVRSDGDPAFVGTMREAHGAPLSWPGSVSPRHAGASSASGAEGVMAGAPSASNAPDALSPSGRLEGLEHHIDESLMSEFRENDQRVAREKIEDLERRVSELSFELERARAGNLHGDGFHPETQAQTAELLLVVPEPATAGSRETEIAALEAEIARLQGEITRLEGEVSRLTVESEGLREDGVAARAEIVRLRESAGSAPPPSPSPPAEGEREQVERSLAAARELQQQAEKAREEAEQMLFQAERARTEERKSRAEAIKARDSAIKARTAAEMRTETSLRNEATAQARLVEMQTQMTRLMTELQEARATAARAGAGDGAAKDSDSKTRVHELDARVRDLTAELEQARSEASTARAETESARSRLDHANAELERANAACVGARAELESARAEAEGMRAELAGVRDDLRTARTELERASGAAVALATPAAAADTERVRDLVTKIVSLERLLESAQVKGGDWGEFIATLSHEIRTPMNGVIGMAHLLLDSGLDAQQRTWVEIIRHSAHALLALINNSLDFTRLETGRIEFEDVDFDLRVTVHEVQNVLAPLAREKHLTVGCNVHHEVPSRLRGDAGRLRQVIQNMMGSAIHCSDGGEVRLTVERESESEEGVRLRFRITGSGVGASEEHMTNLFQTFVGEDNEIARRFGADGLGLAVARKLVRMLQGEVGLECHPTTGTTPWFTLTIPKQPEVTSPAESPQVRLRGLRALIVDASPASRRAMAEMLTAWGSRADESANAEEALLRLESAIQEGDPFKVAILDMDLPGTSGEVLGGRIAAAPSLRDTRTMLLTSVGRRGDATRVQGLGFSAYLIKPIQWTELHDALVQVVQTHPAAEEATLVTRHSIAESRRNRARILIVDDDPVNQLVTDWTLRRHGYTTERASTAARALEMFDEQRPEIVLLDIALPDLDGYKVAQAIRAKEPKGSRTPIIAVTGKMMPGDRARCLAAGMDDYVTKPIDLGELCGCVERWMQRSQKDGRAAAPARPAAAAAPRVPVIAPPISDADPDPTILLASDDDFAAPAVTGPPRLALVQPEGTLPIEPTRHLSETGDELVLADDGFAGGSSHNAAPRLETPVSADSGPETPTGDFVFEKAPDRGVMSSGDPSVLDMKRLDDASMGIPALREALLGTFLGDLKPRIERLDQSIQNRNSMKLENEAHGLRGMAATIGAVGLVSVFQEIERLAHDERFEGMDELIERARQQARKFDDHVRSMNARQKRAA